MALREKKSTKQRYIDPVEREQKKKIFIVSEGDKTEIKYFQGLKDNAKDLGIDNVIIVLEKDEESKGISDPEGLIKLAEEKKKSLLNPDDCNEVETYDPDIDEFLIIRDCDKDYNKDSDEQKESETEYHNFIKNYKDEYIIGVTNPCFEIWLLLHKEKAVADIINPNYEEILLNRTESTNHTFISKLVSDEFHMNPKTGMKFSKFKDSVLNAIEQEKLLIQDIDKLENKVGSNIGKIIETKFLKK